MTEGLKARQGLGEIKAWWLHYFFLIKMGQPRPLFSFIFAPPPNKQYNFYNKSLWKNVHPVKRRRDANTRPFEHESSPITTRPELPPNFISSCITFSSSTRTSTCPSWRSWPPSGCPFLWWSDSTSGSGTRRSRDRGNLFTFKLARRRAANDRIRGKFSSRHLAFWA